MSYDLGSLLTYTATALGTRTSPDQRGDRASELNLVIDVTAIGGTPSMVVTIQGKDQASGKYYTILASAAITGVGTTILRVGRGLTAAANLVVNDRLPPTWRISSVLGGGGGSTLTGTIGAALISR